MNQAINIRKSDKGVTNETEHISNNNSQREKNARQIMKKQKIKLNYNKIHHTKVKKE